MQGNRTVNTLTYSFNSFEVSRFNWRQFRYPACIMPIVLALSKCNVYEWTGSVNVAKAKTRIFRFYDKQISFCLREAGKMLRTGGGLPKVVQSWENTTITRNSEHWSKNRAYFQAYYAFWVTYYHYSHYIMCIYRTVYLEYTNHFVTAL